CRAGTVGQMAVEVPADSSLRKELVEVFRAGEVEDLDLREFGQAQCLVLGPSPQQSPGWLDLVLRSGPGPDIGPTSEQDRTGAEWELAATRARAEELDQRVAVLAAELKKARRTEPADRKP